VTRSDGGFRLATSSAWPAAAWGTDGPIETLTKTQTNVDQTEGILSNGLRGFVVLPIVGTSVQAIAVNAAKTLLVKAVVAAAPHVVKAVVEGARLWLDKIEQFALNKMHLSASSTHSTVDQLGYAALNRIHLASSSTQSTANRLGHASAGKQSEVSGSAPELDRPLELAASGKQSTVSSPAPDSGQEVRPSSTRPPHSAAGETPPRVTRPEGGASSNELDRLELAASGKQSTVSGPAPDSGQEVRPASTRPTHSAAGETPPRVTRPEVNASSNVFSTNLEPLFAKMLEQVHQQISKLESEMCRMVAEVFKGLPALLDKAGKDLLALLDSLEKRSAFGHSRSQGTNPTSESPAAPGSDAASGAVGPDAATVHLGAADLVRQGRIRAQLQPAAGGGA